jgi:multidrug efflux pump subunit AcrA (membrane-fusion protein)
MTKTTLIITILFLGFLACKQKDKELEDIEKSAYLEDKNQVEVMVLEPSTFTKQLVSNGKLSALYKSELKFRGSDEIVSIAVKNGQHVL